ncbi:DUF3035 domain-containing protein [Pelagibacterales bacterium SAG-MED20]|nr:DUF3035 domain-containing protein [Pelagibacterales bacterium SAG-MED20]
MKRSFKNIFYLVLVLVFLSACQSVKDGLTGKKQNNSDEFLVEKKNPLVLPPEYDRLPEPKKSSNASLNQEDINLEGILKKDSSTLKASTSKTLQGSVEESILEKIKSN